MPNFNWKYETADATPTIVIVASPKMAMSWMSENNLNGNWRTYFTERTDDPPNWPVTPGALVLTPSGGENQVLTQGTSDEAATWLNNNADQVPWDTTFVVRWYPPQVG